MKANLILLFITSFSLHVSAQDSFNCVATSVSYSGPLGKNFSMERSAISVNSESAKIGSSVISISEGAKIRFKVEPKLTKVFITLPGAMERIRLLIPNDKRLEGTMTLQSFDSDSGMAKIKCE